MLLPGPLWYIYSSVSIPPLETRTLDFGGEPDEKAEELDRFEELQLTRAALDVSFFRFAIRDLLGYPKDGRYWMLLHTRRHTLLPHDRSGQPGDFDIIVGRSDDDVIAFDELAYVEIKRRVVAKDGSPRSPPSGLGTTQARAGGDLGFDRVLLLHLVVGPDVPEAETLSSMWRPLTNARALGRGLGATLGMLRAQLGDGSESPFGVAVMVWGRAPGSNAAQTGALAFHQHASTPHRPHRHSNEVAERRKRLVAGLRILIGERRPAADVLALCANCGALASGSSPSKLSCQCGNPRLATR